MIGRFSGSVHPIFGLLLHVSPGYCNVSHGTDYDGRFGGSREARTNIPLHAHAAASKATHDFIERRNVLDDVV